LWHSQDLPGSCTSITDLPTTGVICPSPRDSGCS
jgi:hypothetical protein